MKEYRINFPDQVSTSGGRISGWSRNALDSVTNAETIITSTGGVLFPNLEAEDATTNNVGFEVVSPFGNITGSTAFQPLQPIGTFPIGVYRGFLLTTNGGTGSVKYTGLTPGYSFSITLAAHQGNASRNTDVTVNGVTKSYSSASQNEPQPENLTWDGVVPESGEITISVKKSDINGQYYGALTAIQLITQPAGPTITAGSDIANENQTSTFVLINNQSDPTAVTVNGVAGTNLQMVSEDVGAGTQTWSYTPPLIADDATADLVVTVDGADTTAFQIAYENSYDRSQTAHGEPTATSVNFGNTYASANPYEWKVITDTNPAIAIIDWNLMETSDGMNLGIENFITTVAEGITSAEIGVFIPETGQTATFTRTFEISTDGSVSNPDPDPDPEPDPEPEPEPTLPTTLDEVQVNVRGRVLTFIDIGDGFGILKDALSAVDLRTMEDVSDNGTGSTLKSKIENHRMGNGRKVTDVYKNAMVNISGYSDQIEKKVLTSKKAETISSHASRLDSLENP